MVLSEEDRKMSKIATGVVFSAFMVLRASSLFSTFESMRVLVS